MPYEEGMTIIYDVVSKAVIVEFRGKFVTLQGPFADKAEGVRAGEEFCRKRGWKDRECSHAVSFRSTIAAT